MNNRNVGLNVILFTSGSVIGAIVSWIATKNAYQKKNQEDLESVREFYKQKEKDIIAQLQKEYGFEIKKEKKETDSPKKDTTRIAGSKIDYTKFYNDLSSDPPDDILAETTKPILPPEAIPYIIDPEEYGEDDDYETLTLTYYSDDVLVDEDDEPVVNRDEVVGSESLKRFGEFVADTVFVRNERLKCDYEILRDNRKYSDILDENPFLNNYIQATGGIDS